MHRESRTSFANVNPGLVTVIVGRKCPGAQLATQFLYLRNARKKQRRRGVGHGTTYALHNLNNQSSKRTLSRTWPPRKQPTGSYHPLHYLNERCGRAGLQQVQLLTQKKLQLRVRWATPVESPRTKRKQRNSGLRVSSSYTSHSRTTLHGLRFPP